MDAVSAALLAAYASLGLELWLLAVPSEASTASMLAARAASRPRHVLLHSACGALTVTLLSLPLLVTLWPPLRDGLGRLAFLERAPLRVAGVALALGGRALSIVSLLQLRARRGAAAGVLGMQTRGLYARSRNPVLLGMFAFHAGCCLVYPSVVLILGSLPYAWHMHRRVLLEEGHLSSVLGAPYREYLGRVPRYLRIL